MMKRGQKEKVKSMGKRAAAVTDMLFYVIVAVIVIAIFVFAYLYFSGTLQGAGEYIKNMFRNIFGG